MDNLGNMFIATMTAAQLKDYLFGEAGAKSETNTKADAGKEKRYLYSVRELASFLRVSYTTAWKLKSTVLKSAVYQQGRTILIDADEVVKLMGNG